MKGCRFLKLVVTGVALACMSVFAAGESLLPDGGFEQGGKGWDLPKPFWGVKKGGGFGGSAGLSFEVRKGERIKWPSSQYFMVEGGLAYRINAVQKTDGFKVTGGKGTVKLYFMVFDKDGKSLGSFGGANRAMDNSVRKDGWYRVEGVTRVLPAEAVKARLHIWSYDGTGEAFIDDIVVRPESVNPVDQLCCSAYRSEAWEGNVSFSAAYCSNPLKNPDGALECELEYVGVKGKAKAKGVLKDGVATVKLPVSDFAFGCNDVTLEVRRRDGTAVLGKSSCTFRREYGPMPRKVTSTASRSSRLACIGVKLQLRTSRHTRMDRSIV